MTWQDDLVVDLRRDEGERLKPYTDSVGKVTIGVGRNLTDNGLSLEEAAYLLGNDMGAVERDLTANAPWWSGLSDPVKRGLMNMAFNLGWPRLSAFQTMLTALHEGRWNDAADAALDSAWARQVGIRATRIANLFRSAAIPLPGDGINGTDGVNL